MKILFITLSNLGDVVLSLPVLDTLLKEYKDAEIYCVTSPRCMPFLESIKEIKGIIPYKKRMGFRDFWRFFFSLRKNRYDLVVDLRNSLIPYLVSVRIRTPLFLKVPRDVHRLEKFRMILSRTLRKEVVLSKRRREFSISLQREKELTELVIKSNPGGRKIIFFGVGARSHIKRYPPEHFSWLIRRAYEERFFSILCGDDKDRTVSEQIRDNIPMVPFLDLCGRTTFPETAYLLKRYAFCSISCDSAFLHLSSYLNIPTLGIFGPTSPQRYGPWADVSGVIYNSNIECRPCEKSVCRYNHECMRGLNPEEVWNFCHTIIAKK